MGRQTGPTAATVALVWERDNGSCLRCGRGLRFEGRGVEWSLHHRAPRGMGGTRQPWINKPGNLVTLCGSGVTGCHGWVEANRGQATEQGWLVSRLSVKIPVLVPVVDLDGIEWWLSDYGAREQDKPQPF